MTTQTEDTQSENDTSSCPDRPGASGDTASSKGPAQRPVTSGEWRRLRAPFSREAYVVGSRATGRTAANLPLGAYSGKSSPAGEPGSSGESSGESSPESGNDGENLNQAVVDLRLRPEAIRDRLDLILSPGRYGYRLEPGPEAGGTFSMRCHLRIGPGRRTGVGTGRSPQEAGRVALASAAKAFGMGATGKVAGPVVADRESWHRLPGPVLERLEQEEEPAPWTPGGEPLEEASQA